MGRSHFLQDLMLTCPLLCYNCAELCAGKQTDGSKKSLDLSPLWGLLYLWSCLSFKLLTLLGSQQPGLSCYSVELALTKTRQNATFSDLGGSLLALHLGVCTAPHVCDAHLSLFTLRPVCTPRFHSCHFYELDHPDHTFPGLLTSRSSSCCAVSRTLSP